MNAPQPPENQQFGGPNQQEQGQGAQPPSADATQVVPGGGQNPVFPPPEATQVVPSSGSQPAVNPDATQVVPPSATQQPSQFGQPSASGGFPAQPAVSGGFPAQQPPAYGQPPQQFGQPAQQFGQPPQPPAYGANPYAQQQQQPYVANPYAQQQPWGAQQPAYGRPATPPPAGGYAEWGTRALGALVDYIAPGVVVAILVIVGSATGDPTIALVLSGIGYVAQLGWLIYNSWYLAGTTGQSYGKKIAKIKLIKEETGQPIGFGNAFVRYLCHFVDSLVCLVGWFAPLWDVKKQTWADKIMGTVVVNAPDTGLPGGGYPGVTRQANPYAPQPQQGYGAPQSNPYGQPQQQPNPYGQQPPQQW
ncbi:RDD family protein [Saccharothrix obliqua]|uniref:RDD family protein n=1 Tax=Saccharothrix obliqua TaxID=2861747 RepID=UPI001C5F89F2|nr:RDD family protein [Saccharothrix obliqua]MBW4719185.1 RDD family protein [Saccharothrix obliqua]